MNHQNHCPTCQSPLPEGTPAGRCPQCLLRAAAHQTSASRIGKSSFTPPTPNELDAALEGFEVLSLIGQGGMGAVYKAIHLRLDRVVAIKVLPTELDAADPAFGERFLREARSLAKLQHPNLVVVHDFGEVDGLYFIVMEYVEGANLRERLRDGSLRPDAALKILPQICEGLRYAHGQGLVHRDIKPENILLGNDGRVRIADFGLARMVHPDASDISLTGTEQALGTPHYMAPEQLRDPDRVDHRADLFSLGVVFYEMLTGNLPQGRFPLPSEEVEVSKHVDEVVLKSLEPNPERRYQQAMDMEEDLGAPERKAVPVREAAPKGDPAPQRTASPAAAVAAESPDPVLVKSMVGGLLISALSFLPWGDLMHPMIGAVPWNISSGTIEIFWIDVPLGFITLLAFAVAVIAGLQLKGMIPVRTVYAKRISLVGFLMTLYCLFVATWSWMNAGSTSMLVPNYDSGNPALDSSMMDQVIETTMSGYVRPGFGLLINTCLFFWTWRTLRKAK